MEMYFLIPSTTVVVFFRSETCVPKSGEGGIDLGHRQSDISMGNEWVLYRVLLSILGGTVASTISCNATSGRAFMNWMWVEIPELVRRDLELAF